jgi:hypothetical protein
LYYRIEDNIDKRVPGQWALGYSNSTVPAKHAERSQC